MCPKCKVPLAISDNLDFDLRRHLVWNKKTGAREVTMVADSFSAVFRELEKELGSEIPLMVEELERTYMRESSGKQKRYDEFDDVRQLLSTFTWRGLGNPVKVDCAADSIEVVIENPFHSGMVAGRVSGLVEAMKQQTFESHWTEKAPGILSIRLS